MPTVSAGGETTEPAGPYVEFPGSVKPLGVLDGGFPNVGPTTSELGLRSYDGDIVVTPSNSPRGLHVTGKLTLAGGTVTNSVVHGHRNVTSQDAIVTGANYDAAGTVLAWVRLDGRGSESPWKNGIDGGGYTLRYSEILGVVDGIGANYAGRATIEGCRIYHGWYEAWNDKALAKPRTSTFVDAYGVTHLAPFPSQSSGDSHGDGAQLFGWGGWVIRNNNLGGKRGTTASTKLLDPTIVADADVMRALAADPSFNNTAIMVNATAAHPVGALIEGNWLEGGAAVVNLQTVTGDLLAGVTIRNNIITPGAGFDIYLSDNHQATITRNTHPDGSPAIVRTRPA